jgi:hypothetical protein
MMDPSQPGVERLGNTARIVGVVALVLCVLAG